MNIKDRNDKVTFKVTFNDFYSKDETRTRSDEIEGRIEKQLFFTKSIFYAIGYMSRESALSLETIDSDVETHLFSIYNLSEVGEAFASNILREIGRFRKAIMLEGVLEMPGFKDVKTMSISDFVDLKISQLRDDGRNVDGLVALASALNRAEQAYRQGV